MKQYRSPTGSLIAGTSDTVPCRANILGIEDDGSPVYSGANSVFWDDQKPNERAGRILFIDDDGAEWTFDQLTPVEDEPITLTSSPRS